MAARQRLAELADDDTHGAAEIAGRARQLLARLVREDEDPTGAARSAALDLLRGHPTMAPIVHLANDALTLLEREGPTSLADLADRSDPREAIAAHAAPEVLAADRVLAYSRSGTVVAAIESALDQGAEATVVASEARPGNEGVGVATRLAEAGADVELTYDAHLLGRARRADLVLVGADAIAAESFVNKTGTRVLLDQARRAGTSTRVLAATDKLWPTSLPVQPPTDVQTEMDVDVPASVRVTAPVFESVPLSLVDRIVTEEGPRKPRELAEEAEAVEVHDRVAAVLQG